MDEKIYIESIGAVSSLGTDSSEVIKSIRDSKPQVASIELNSHSFPVFPIHKDAESALKQLLKNFPKYKNFDRSVQLGILASDLCIRQVKNPKKSEWIINAASSRGATHIWEKSHHSFIESGQTSVKTSPLTTLGNISFHIAQHQRINGFQIDHSITCGSGLQALANGVAWLKADMADSLLAVATEAPLTNFTVAQMAALGIYSGEKGPFPCKPCSFEKQVANTFVLGEAAVAISLFKKPKSSKGDVMIAGIGTGSEAILHPASISKDGEAFRKAMSQALKLSGLKPAEIDVIIPHSPGTKQGDQSEFEAIQTIFKQKVPKVINHKFLTGHTLGASGLLSVQLGYLMLTEGVDLEFPYPSLYPPVVIKPPQTILINAMGFGGNAVSIILKKS